MSEQSFPMSVPLDSDGFLRRECPTCEREFKLLPSPPTAALADTGSGDEPASPSYTCPYCGIQAPAGAWATTAQVELGKAIVMREVVGPKLKEFGRELESMSRRSGGLVTFSARVEHDKFTDDPVLTESDDMRRVDFACHPGEPLKILDDWQGDVFCLICGAPATAAS